MTRIEKHHNPYTAGIAALLAVLVIFLTVTFTSRKIHSSASFDQVNAAILENLDANIYPRQGVQKLRRDLKLDSSDAQNIAWYRMDDAMSASELLVVQFSEEQQEALESAVIKRKNAQQTLYEGYAPEQAETMKNALIDFQGNYGIYYTGLDGQKIDQAFLNALRRR